ncbi:MAG TPA: NAD(P)-dependent oxidoreductase [Candidatus Baltobacteraceae bacterium]|nr:NAD(P)-dependent oxidoreductase [Candidatus Baltobacteraceae bacterium]
MAEIALYGATGMIGQRILKEALSRGHKVTAVVRDVTKAPQKSPNLEIKPGDILKPESVAAAIAGNSVVVSAFGPRGGDPGDYQTAIRALMEGIQAAKETTGKPIRLIFVGGAASLEIAPGQILLDTPNFPPAWKPAASASREVLGTLRREGAAAGLDWTYFSPAMFIQPGERTGKYRLGTDQLVVDSKGESRISAEDYAVALVDEIEKPQFTGRRFTAAY